MRIGISMLAVIALLVVSAAPRLRGSELQIRQEPPAPSGALAPEEKRAAPLLWKSVANALLRVNDQGLKEWRVFQIEKKNARFLVQLADRFLLVDPPRKEVFDLAPEKVSPSGADVLWDPADRPAKPLATSGWLARDVGPAYRIRVRLDAEDRTLDLQVPHLSSRP